MEQRPRALLTLARVPFFAAFVSGGGRGWCGPPSDPKLGVVARRNKDHWIGLNE
jgi:hypothetical protein